MRLCRFDDDRLGWIEGDRLFDVSAVIAACRPARFSDPLIARLRDLEPALRAERARAQALALDKVCIKSPVPWPSKVMAAPGNYRMHVENDTKDPGMDPGGMHRKSVQDVERPVDKLGLFLKASSSVAGPGEGVQINWPDRRVDQEVELVAVIGREGREIPRERAYDYVAGYTVGLDISVRGAEDRSFRKSSDTFTLVGPALVTPDEIGDPMDLAIWVDVNGERRQHSSTAAMTVGLAELIEIASRAYTLYPGDLLMTGTPAGVGPIKPGDVVRAGGDGLGEMTVVVRG